MLPLKIPKTREETPGERCPRCGSSHVRGGICPTCVFASLVAPEALAEELPAAPPLRVGDYELIEQIARGGMGVVWRARQRRLNREVALKFVLEGALPGETAARRFRQEAEVAAQLGYPHIIAVYEVGEADGRYFISMELAEGGTLAQRLQGGRFEPRAAAELAGKLARAIQHAHDRGVLHRDLKPGNVLFDAAGEPRISDFGLARLLVERGTITVTGAIMGTPSYMSPEQARGESKELTTASDIYALGTILYEMLAGRPAFGGDVPLDVLRRVLDEEPPRLVGIDRDLETICQTCLAKNPPNRYRSASALAEDLDRWLADEPIHARRASTMERIGKWLRRHPLLATLWVALAFSVVLLAGVLVNSRMRVAEARGAADASAMESGHRRADQHTTTAILAIERGDALRALPSLAEAIRIGTGDPVRDRVNRIRFESILRLSPRLEQIWFTHFAWDVQFAGDGVLICEGRTARLLDAKDGRDAVPPMEHGDPVTHAAMHPTLNRILTESKVGKCYVWDSTNGTRLARIPGHFMKSSLLFPKGGAQLAVWDGRVAGRYSVAGLAYDGAVLEHPANVEWAYLGEGGRRMVTFAADLQLRVWDAETGAPVGSPIPCNEGTRLHGVQPGKGRAVLQSKNELCWLLDVQRGEHAGSTAIRGDVRAAGWILGRLVLMMASRDGFVVMGAGEGEVLVSATHAAHGNDAAFSDDGTICVTRAIDGSSRLWSLQSARPITPFLWEGADPLYLALDAKNGRLVTSSQESAVRLWRMRERGGAVSESVVSPASQKLAWLKAELGTLAKAGVLFHRAGVDGRPALRCSGMALNLLRVYDPATGRDLIPPLKHHAQVLNAVFSPDGRRIASYASNQCAYLWDATTGEQIGPLLRHERMIDILEFSPDGSLLLTGALRTLRLWEASTGAAASPTWLHADPVLEATWNADGTAVVSVDRLGVRREWKVSPGNRPLAELEALAQLYSVHRVTKGGGLVPLGVEESKAAWQKVGLIEDR